MRATWHVLGALAIVTALAYARDVADPAVVPGRPAPLSIESMRAIADENCKRPPGYRAGTLQMLRESVLEVGVTDSELIVCTVSGSGHGQSTGKTDEHGTYYVAGRTGLVWDDQSVEVGRVAPGVAVLEFVLPSGKAVRAELYGEVFLCHVPEKITSVRIRAYDAGGHLLQDVMI
ncbi:hypothetical protein SK571_06700 [Lentzea sp. BCCO 10_0798]|uniref:Uncharacterized protein n=1 Tax=Lentzea kristufekii TaxID=3095430 RepID=A0ABU4TLV0_9PSEU|nr:hypothetical protein [Lentzea sp. BCCO 10_0798]MDX8049063.1 hypothetical protein [Lentzea sp. BCCO 10_0798]